MGYVSSRGWHLQGQMVSQGRRARIRTVSNRKKTRKALANKLSGLPGKVASVTARTEKKKPELLYDLTNLQKESNKRFGFTAEHTLAVAQELYEAKLISYPRTNSRYLTESDAQKTAGWIKAIAQGQLTELQPFVAGASEALAREARQAFRERQRGGRSLGPDAYGEPGQRSSRVTG